MLVQQNDGEAGFFFQKWEDYNDGFGEKSGNYWIGNHRLHRLTKYGRYQLKVELKGDGEEWLHAWYRDFRVGTERSNYKLRVSGFYGASDGVQDALSKLNGMLFSTFDRDNDNIEDENAAESCGGGFWYAQKFECSLNAADMSWAGMSVKKSRMTLECV